MAVLNLRNVPENLMLALGIAAAQRGIGKHALALEILESYTKRTVVTASRAGAPANPLEGSPFVAPEYMDIEIT